MQGRALLIDPDAAARYVRAQEPTTSQFQTCSSRPPDQEATFAVYEEHVATSTKKANTFGLAAGIGLGLLVIIIAFTVTPKHDDPMADPSAKKTEQLQK